MRKPLTETSIHDYLERMEPLEKAFDMIDDHVVVTDPDGNVLYANNAVLKNTGFSPAEAVGKNPGDLWGGQMPKEFYERMWHTIKDEKKPFVGEVRNKRKDGTEYWQEIHISPVLNDTGDVAFFIGIEPNITDKKLKERFRDEFLGIVGHQLRNPLAAVKWALQWLLMKGGLTDEQMRALEEAYGENQNLVGLVNDLLTLSRVEKGNPYAETRDLAADIGELIESERHTHPRVEFSYHADGMFPITVNASLMRQVFSNILDNAAEYSRNEGRVEVMLSKERALYRFTCKDFGIGIPIADQEKIFTRFFRASNAERAKKTGTGLGLSIVKMIADAFGWTVSLESVEDIGTTVTVIMPISS